MTEGEEKIRYPRRLMTICCCVRDISKLLPEVELHEGASGRIVLSESTTFLNLSTKHNQEKCNSFA
jgi:hypothetical protein